MITFKKNIFGKILSIAWHPTVEKYLAYSTEEGVVGIIDTSKPDNGGTSLNPFFGKPVYQISWGNIETVTNNGSDDADEITGKNQKCVLFACSMGKVVYFPEDKTKSTKTWNRFVPINDLKDVSAISAGKHFIAIGMLCGGIALYSFQLKVSCYIAYISLTWMCVGNMCKNAFVDINLKVHVVPFIALLSTCFILVLLHSLSKPDQCNIHKDMAYHNSVQLMNPR